MNIPYEMFLNIQLMHLNCRKDRVQSPTRKEGRDLQFRRTSDDSSRNNPRWRIIWRYFQRNKRSQTQCSYVTLLSDIVDAKPSSYEEVAKKKGKESTSSRRMMNRMKCLRPEGKYVVSSIRIYKIQHAVDGNIVGYKAIFVARGFSQKEGIHYKETFAATGS